MYFTDIKHDNVSKCIVFYTVEYKLVLTLIFNTLNFIYLSWDYDEYMEAFKEE